MAASDARVGRRQVCWITNEEERTMSEEENKAIIRKVYEELNKGNFDVIDECFDENFVRYIVSGQTQDRGETKQFLLGILRIYPDIHRGIDWIVAEGSQVAFSFTWTGTNTGEAPNRPPTGKKATIEECYYSRFENGKIVEYRQYADRLNLYNQMGVTPPPPPEEIGK